MNQTNCERYIADLLAFISIQYKKAKPEIATIYAECFELTEEEFSIFDEVSLYSETIEGIAYKYSQKNMKDFAPKLQKLKNTKLQENSEFIYWFSKNYEKYREYSIYILTLETLRTTMISNMETISN